MKKILVFLTILLLLAACGPAANSTETKSGPEDAYPAGAETAVSSEATQSVFLPAVGGGETQAYPSGSGTVEPSALPITTGVARIYLVALEDNGVSGKLIGCNDSLVPVEIMVDPGADALRAALENLLSQKEQYYGESGLYNALYQSNLRIDKIEIEAAEIKVELVGTMALGGVCDNPRFGEQLTETVAQFAEGRQVKIEINNKSLDEVLSLK